MTTPTDGLALPTTERPEPVTPRSRRRGWSLRAHLIAVVLITIALVVLSGVLVISKDYRRARTEGARNARFTCAAIWRTAPSRTGTNPIQALSHDLLISLLSEKIHDGRFIRLMKQLLDAGYLEDWRFNQTLSGVPQGSVVSPILSNILLNKLDHYVETVLIPQYTRGEKKQVNPIYKRLMSKAENRFKRGLTMQAQQFRKAAQQLPSKDPQDSNYRR